MPTTVLLLVVALVTTACAGAGDASAPDGTAPPGEQTSGAGRAVSERALDLMPTPRATAPARPVTVRGELRTDAQLEGGCGWIDGADGRRWQVRWPDGWRLEVGAGTLRDPDGRVAATSGDVVEVRGVPQPELLTTCQVGTVLRGLAVTTPAE